ncbi:MAG: methionyl-tRNA formyltransferase [Rhodoferax sp.]|nr:methionyl-tRNA formyltransferase [Rhodoferax sp.]
MKVVFAGTPEFARSALDGLCDAGFELALVLTQPDRPAGRGMKLHESPVKVLARARGIPVVQPRSLRLDGRFAQDAELARQALVDAQAQVMVVAAYGLILPQWVLDLMRQPQPLPQPHGTPGLGCFNIHASLLPRWRGAAPIHRAIEAGDSRTGVTIMQMDVGLDTGDMLLMRDLPICHIGPDADTTGSLHDKLATTGAELIVTALQAAEVGQLLARPQPTDGITYAHKVDKVHALVDWSASAELIERRIRAFNPAPGAWTGLEGQVVKLWRAEVMGLAFEAGAPCGTILAVGPHGIDIACGEGVLRLHELQRAGAKRMDAAAFVRGTALHPGLRLVSPAAEA